MTTKTTSAEWNRYYSDKAAWPEGQWHDDVLILLDGKDVSNDASINLGKLPDGVVTVESGVIYDFAGDDVDSLESHFKKWRKQQTTAIVAVKVAKEKLDELKALVKTVGAKVI